MHTLVQFESEVSWTWTDSWYYYLELCDLVTYPLSSSLICKTGEIVPSL